MIQYRKNKLFVESVPAEEIAESVGTPAYVYSKNQLLRSLKAYRRAFRAIPHEICYALKANSNLTLLRLLAEEGSGADVVSGGELYRALRAGFPPGKIVFAGVGKTAEEIEFALRKRIFSLHVESEQELLLINSIASRLKTIASVSLRVNPDVDARTHPYISTGLKKHKFGIPMMEAFSLYQKTATMKSVKADGMHIHLGSQIIDAAPFRDAAVRCVELMDRLALSGMKLEYLDAGGGLGIDYDDPFAKADPRKLAALLVPLLKKRRLRLLLEPGRSIIAAAGILLTRVLYTKQNHGKTFVIVDAGMNDFIRPALYDAFHSVLPFVKKVGRRRQVDIVGPVCETGDFLAKSRMLPVLAQGDCLAVMHAGAYGFSMTSNYNSRRRPVEVLVDDDQFHIIRKRESYADLMRGE